MTGHVSTSGNTSHTSHPHALWQAPPWQAPPWQAQKWATKRNLASLVLKYAVADEGQRSSMYALMGRHQAASVAFRRCSKRRNGQRSEISQARSVGAEVFGG